MAGFEPARWEFMFVLPELNLYKDFQPFFVKNKKLRGDLLYCNFIFTSTPHVV